MDDTLWKHVKYFKRAEFDSKDKDGSGVGTGSHMDVRLVFALDALRGLMGRGMSISSGYRTVSHNKAVKGAPQSAHLKGLAVDISTKSWTERERIDLIIYAKKLGFTGVGIAPTFIHLDMKLRTASWIYPANGGQKNIPVGEEFKYA